ncbi:MAG: D-glycero-beta-D-manno-heptose 1-phosphate adenylyltransferase [Haliscomenobacter sp.]
MSFLSSIQAKVVDWEQAEACVAAWRSQGLCIVFTNGCFDLLHFGHLHYLAQARDLGDRLVVGLNAEGSVRRLKGPGRPIHDEPTRFLQMASLACVDLVVGFEQDTPQALIHRLMPDVLVKGGDYSAAQIVGADLVLARGGRVETLPFVNGYSTTAIEQKILRQSKH